MNKTTIKKTIGVIGVAAALSLMYSVPSNAMEMSQIKDYFMGLINSYFTPAIAAQTQTQKDIGQAQVDNNTKMNTCGSVSDCPTATYTGADGKPKIVNAKGKTPAETTATFEAAKQEQKRADETAAAGIINGQNDAVKKSIAAAAANNGAIVQSEWNAARAKGIDKLDPTKAATTEQTQINEVYRLTGGDPKNMGNDPIGDSAKISKLLTPYLMLPAGVSFSDEMSAFTTSISNGSPVNRQMDAVTDVLMGVTPTPILPRSVLISSNGKSLQAKIFTRFARLQLARQMVGMVYSKPLLDGMNSEYAAFVSFGDKDPSKTPTKYSTDEQMAMMIQGLRGINYSLLNMRRLQMETNRLLAIMLTAQLESSPSSNDLSQQ